MYTLCKYKAIVQSSLVRTRTEFLLPIKLYELEFILYSLCIKDVNRYHNRISIQSVRYFSYRYKDKIVWM